MGFPKAKDLEKLVKERYQKTYSESIHISELGIKTMIVDFSYLLHILYYREKKDTAASKPPTTAKTLIAKFNAQFSVLENAGITLTFVISLGSGKIKEKEQDKRISYTKINLAKMEKLFTDKSDLDFIAKINGVYSKLSKTPDDIKLLHMYKNTVNPDFHILRTELLDYIENHYDCVYSKPGFEDEIYAAHLVKQGKFDAIYSKDFDVIVVNPGLVIREVTTSGYAKIVRSEKFYEAVNLTVAEFTDYYLLCGCDFCDFPGIGVKRGYTLIKKYGSIEKILESKGKLIVNGLITAKKKNCFDYCAGREQFYISDIVYDLTKFIPTFSAYFNDPIKLRDMFLEQKNLKNYIITTFLQNIMVYQIKNEKKLLR